MSMDDIIKGLLDQAPAPGRGRPPRCPRPAPGKSHACAPPFPGSRACRILPAGTGPRGIPGVSP